MTNTYHLGQIAESTALHYLTARGLRLIERNYRCYHGEIDLIVNDKDDIVFIEVRSRSRFDFGRAAESITHTKKQRLLRTATQFLQKTGRLYKVNSRFDVIAIHYCHGNSQNSVNDQIEWIKNAFTIDT